jgi:hypothetical protein
MARPAQTAVLPAASSAETMYKTPKLYPPDDFSRIIFLSIYYNPLKQIRKGVYTGFLSF